LGSRNAAKGKQETVDGTRPENISQPPLPAQHQLLDLLGPTRQVVKLDSGTNRLETYDLFSHSPKGLLDFFKRHL